MKIFVYLLISACLIIFMNDHTNASEIHFSVLTKTAIQSALRAGDILKEGFETDFQIFEKEGKQNLVTEYDTKAEKAIIDLIKEQFPDHTFLGEETGKSGELNAPVVWIIDPLDGTRNYANKISLFSISLAASINGQVVSGVIYLPLQNELFVAELGKGAYLNGQPLQVSTQEKFEKIFLATGFPYNIDKNPLHCIDLFSQIVQTGIQVRDLGSAAIHLAYVAAGKFDAFWHAELQPWDYAAGKLLIEEAGGKISLWNGQALDIFSPSTIIASNGLIHQIMLQQINKIL